MNELTVVQIKPADRKQASHLCVLLLRAHLLHLLQDLLGLVNISFCSELFGLGQELSNFFVQLMDLLCLKFSINATCCVSSQARGTKIRLASTNCIKEVLFFLSR